MLRIPIELKFHAEMGAYNWVTRRVRKRTFQVLVYRIRREYRQLDPWQIRREFLSLDSCSAVEVTKFLHRTGFLGYSFSTTPEEIRDWQQILHTFMTNGTLTEQATRKISLLDTLHVKLQWRKGALYGLIITTNTLRAIMASIQLDLLSGAKFRVCARPECKEIFEVGGNHEKKYHSYDCAHLEAVRASRRRKKITH